MPLTADHFAAIHLHIGCMQTDRHASSQWNTITS